MAEDVGQSLTVTARHFLDAESSFFAVPVVDFTRDAESIYERAQSLGLTLQEYVLDNPAKALREAEASLAEWLKIQSMAAIEGKIRVSDSEEFTINKNTARLIESRVKFAQDQLDRVNEYMYSAIVSGEKRREHLIRVLFNRAVFQKDTRALIYLIDRLDGRPGEQKTVDLDYDNAYNIYQIIHSLFDKQLEVLNSGNGTKLICCSRRSGKTHLLVADDLIEALRVPRTICLYIGETQETTERLVDIAANDIVDSCGLRDKSGKRLNWRHLDNGSQIVVRGLSNTKDIDLIRGLKAKRIVVDEFFHLKDHLLESLITMVLKPMQMDYANDYQFLCAGTPPSIKGTYGERAWKEWEVPHFFWTYKENPYPVDVEAREAFVENVLREMGLSWESTFARREYGGEWIYDEDLLLYPEYHTYNTERVPQFHIDMVMHGIDYGVSDNDAICSIAWDTTNRRGYVFYEKKFNRLDIKDHTISQLEYLRSRVKDAWRQSLDFFPTLDPKEANKRILWSADDNDQHLTDDFNINVRLSDYPELRLNIQNAHKTDQVFMQDKIRDLLRTGDLLLPEDGRLTMECQQTVLKRGPAGQVYPEIDGKVYHPDLLIALRYALYDVIGNERYGANA